MDKQKQQASPQDFVAFAEWVLAACAITHFNWEPGCRAYTLLLAAWSFLVLCFAATLVPVPWLGQSFVAWANLYIVLALSHLAKQRQNQRRGTMVHSGSLGMNIFEVVFPQLRERRWHHRLARNALTTASLAALTFAVPGVGICAAIGFGAQQTLLYRSELSNQMVDQDVFDAMWEAEERSIRIAAIQRRMN
ncbi:MAG: hypothetical protein ACJ8C4_07030 [Gemmataceae bacterium]